MNRGVPHVSRREAIVTLIACALPGLEAGVSFGVAFAVLLGTDPQLSPLFSALGLVGGCAVGVALLRQGGISVPSPEESGASRGALVGLAVGVVAVFLVGGPIVGLLGICVLVGLAVGRMFDRRGG